MKKFIVFIAFVFLGYTSFAQGSFEGIIKWRFIYNSQTNNLLNQKELTPKQQEELNKGIAELETKLNNPDMKALLDSNPSMKAMIEQQLSSMKAMQGTNGLDNLFPKAYTVKIKDGNSYTQVEDGMTSSMGDILYLKSSEKTYYIKNATKTYSVSPKSKSTTDETSATVTPTTETAKILNYNCTKYLVTFTEDGKSKTMFIWATKDLKQYASNSFHAGSSINNQSNMSALKKIDGVALKIEITEQGQKIILEVIELKNTVLPASDFVLPADFKEVPFGL